MQAFTRHDIKKKMGKLEIKEVGVRGVCYEIDLKDKIPPDWNLINLESVRKGQSHVLMFEMVRPR